MCVYIHTHTHIRDCIFVYLAVLGLCCCTSFSLAEVSRDHSSCGVQASLCRSFFLSWSVGSRAFGLQTVGSVAGAHRLSCPEACGIFLDRGLNPLSPALAGRFFTTEPPGNPLCSGF